MGIKKANKYFRLNVITKNYIDHVGYILNPNKNSYGK